jgi:KaiC/GvpD/RAD55 family RecA-like ATPase
MKHNQRDVRPTDEAAAILSGRVDPRGGNTRPVKTKPTIYTYASVPSVWDFESNVRFIVPDLVPEGGITLLTGDSGHGKTLFATAIAGAIVNGGLFLNRQAERRKVLYLDRENPLSLVKQHLHDLHIERTSDLIVWGGWCEHPADGPGSVSLLEFARAEKPVLIFDSLIAFHPGDEQDASETRRYLQRFRDLAAAGATIIVLHHIGKADSAKEYRGSTDIKASVDVAWLLRKEGDPAGLLTELRLIPFKNRIGTCGAIPVSFRDGHFLTEQRAESNREVFERIVRTNPNSTGAEILNLGMAAGLAKHRIEQLKLDGVQQGWLQIRSGKRNTKYYSLAEPTLGEL